MPPLREEERMIMKAGFLEYPAKECKNWGPSVIEVLL
jgi:hypothetical protein